MQAMTDTSGLALWYMARQAEEDEVFVAWALRHYRARRELSDAALAAELGCSIETLPLLALAPRPHPALETFLDDTWALAAAAGCDPIRLMVALRLGTPGVIWTNSAAA